MCFRIAPDGKNMKSLVRLGAILGIVGSTLLGPSPIGKMSALALPEPQILEKLRPVPVFTITDAQGAPLIASVPKTGQGQPGNAFVPAPQQVQSAKTVLQQTGQQVNEFNGVPLFLARGGAENGYLTIQRGQQEVIPLFFNKEDLQGMVDRFKQQQPNVTATIKIEVVNLESVLEALRTENDPFLTQMILIPSRESLEFVRSLQPAGAGQNPQVAPNQTRPAPAAPAPARPAPAPARPTR